MGSTAENYRIRDLADIVARIVPDSRVAFAAGASRDRRCYRVRADKLKDPFEFSPEWTAERGAAQLLAAYRRHDLRPGDFEGIRFRRLAHIHHLRESGRLSDSLGWKDESAPPDRPTGDPR